MSASTFHAFGNESVNTASVISAEWVPGKADPLVGELVVNLGTKEHRYAFGQEGVAKLAEAVGLGECALEHDKAVKAKEKATKDAEHAAAKAAEKAAEDAEHAAAKAAAESEPAKAAHAAHKAHG